MHSGPQAKVRREKQVDPPATSTPDPRAGGKVVRIPIFRVGIFYVGLA
jgi:hypothetical protein